MNKRRSPEQSPEESNPTFDALPNWSRLTAEARYGPEISWSQEVVPHGRPERHVSGGG